MGVMPAVSACANADLCDPVDDGDDRGKADAIATVHKRSVTASGRTVENSSIAPVSGADGHETLTTSEARP